MPLINRWAGDFLTIVLMECSVNHIDKKRFYFILIVNLLTTIIFVVELTQFSYAQTDFQALKQQVVKLEEKLADAKERQEKAYSVQMKLEEQEQQLTSLEESDKYRIQIIEIRANINMIRTKIEAIVKEKNDLEENLRLAKNLQAILDETQITKTSGPKNPYNPAKKTTSTMIDSVAKIKPPLKPEIAAIQPKKGWYIDHVQLSNYFTQNEHDEIVKLFSSGDHLDQDYILKSAYQIYSHTGVSLHFIIQPKNGSTANLEILLYQREDNNSNSYFTYITPMTLSQFKLERFNLTVAK